MKSRQIRAGSPPPATPFSGRLSSLPTHTPVTRSPAKPMKIASRLFCVVPVLPNTCVRSAALRPVPWFTVADSRSSSIARRSVPNRLGRSHTRSNQLRSSAGNPCGFTG